MCSSRPASSPRIWSLRLRLLVGQVVVLAVVCVGITAATEMALRRHLVAQLDNQLGGTSYRSVLMYPEKMPRPPWRHETHNYIRSGPGPRFPVVQIGAAVAALGSLLALILGVSRTTLAMARDRHLPRWLAAVHPRFKVPFRAELVVGAVVAALAATADIRGAIGFSSFGVLVYYAIANASALTLGLDEGRPRRLIPLVGLIGCVVLAFALPLSSVAAGAAVLGVGVAAYGVRRIITRRARQTDSGDTQRSGHPSAT